MDHLERVKQEFTRQADTFDAHAVIADDQVATRFQTAIGTAAEGTLLDVACGPGVVTAALAGRAAAVTAFDATPAMLEKARKRCAEAGLDNVRFEQGNAEALPFDAGAFDGVVTRLAIHHFAHPKRVLDEMVRVLRPGGMAVIADVSVSEDTAEAALQNAIEIIRDPSHVRMLPETELNSLIGGSGLSIMSHSTWDKARELEEWRGIANDPGRANAVRTIARVLAEEGRTAGMGLSIKDDAVVFFHRWHLIMARRPSN